MKYTPATIAKSLMAFITAFGGSAATSVPHDPIGWIGCIGAGLVAGAAVFAVPNKTDVPTVPSPGEIITGLDEIRDHVTNAIEQITNRANGAVGDVISIATGLPGNDILGEILNRKKG